MIEIKEALKANGATKEEIEISVLAVVNICGDHREIYARINALVRAQDELTHLRSTLSQLNLTPQEKPVKRPYVRKPAAPTLIEKSGVGAAMESLKEQQSEQGATLAVATKVIKERKARKRESDAEIKGAIDELTGGVKLSEEEAAANLTIDL